MKGFFFSILFLVCISFNLHSQNGLDTLLVEELKIVNGNGDDFGPVLVDSTTIFLTSSARDPQSEKMMKNNHNICYSKFIDGQWTAPKKAFGMVNSDNHESAAGISDNRKIIFIYKVFNGGDLYFIKRKNEGKWTTPKKLKFNSPFHETSAVKYGSTYLFVSDRPGGKGEHDIYMIKQDVYGAYSEIENVEVLNSELDENHLSISDDGITLYFSSKGFSSIGGYDIYKSVRKGEKWSEPENMGPLVNSEYNEITFTSNNRGMMFFSSDRPSENAMGYNIYSLNEKKIRKTIPVILAGEAPIEENETGKIKQLINSIELEGYSRDFPDKIIADISDVSDSIKVLYVKDLPVNDKLDIVGDISKPVIEIIMIYKRLGNLTLKEVEEQIDFNPRFYKVQVGTFTRLSSIIEFNKLFPKLGDKVLMIKSGDHYRFLIRDTWEEIEPAAEMQKKCLFEYGAVPDTFIAVYDGKGKRIIIYFDKENDNYILLRPEDQFEDLF